MIPKRKPSLLGGIVHTIPQVAELSAGPTYSVMRMCENLLDFQKKVTLAVLDCEGHRPVPDYVQRFAPSRGLGRLGASSDMHAWLRKSAIDGTMSIIHSHNLWLMPTVYPGWISRLYWTPSVCSPRGALAAAAFSSGSKVKKPFWRIVQKPSLEYYTGFHATAEPELADIRRHGFSQPVAVIPNGIDVPPLVRTPGERRTMLYLGRIHPNKQVEMLVRAWSQLEAEHPDWQLSVVGTDIDARGYLEKMRRLAEELRLERISFDGELVGKAKLDAYRSSDVYVLPTLTENFGVTVAEALAAGTPVIVTKGAPWPNLEANGAGWWIDHGIEPLVASMRFAMSRPREELEEMGRSGRQWMLNDYAWPTLAAKMLEFYEWIYRGMPPEDKAPWIDVTGKRQRRPRAKTW